MASDCGTPVSTRPDPASPASCYSTYSREIKYIFQPLADPDPNPNPSHHDNDVLATRDDVSTEYEDYSHIMPRASACAGEEHKLMSHTPRTCSASSQVSSKENRTPSGDQPQQILSQEHHHHPPSRNSVERGAPPPTASPHDNIYSSTSHQQNKLPRHIQKDPHHQAYTQQQQHPQQQQHHGGNLFTPHNINHQHVNNHLPRQNSHPVMSNSHANRHSPWLNNLTGSTASDYRQVAIPPGPPQHDVWNPSGLKYVPEDIYRSPGSISIHSKNQHNAMENQNQATSMLHQYGTGGHYSNSAAVRGYPAAPPRYSYQQHCRRKTWSPPAIRLSLGQQAGVATHRPCYSNSNDSLDYLGENQHVAEKLAQNLSDDLDTTPPKLAPYSGVLAQVTVMTVLYRVSDWPRIGQIRDFFRSHFSTEIWSE